MRETKYCATAGCGQRIGLLSRYCDPCEAKRAGIEKPEPEVELSVPVQEPPAKSKPNNMPLLTGPCRYCGEHTSAKELTRLYCSASCEEYAERRRQARAARLSPTSPNYYPNTEEELRASKRAFRKRYGSS